MKYLHNMIKKLIPFIFLLIFFSNASQAQAILSIDSSAYTSVSSKYRSAVTGRYVKKGYAVKHPKTTVRHQSKNSK